MRQHTPQREIYTELLTDNLSISVLLIGSHGDCCYRGDAAIVVLRLDVHVDECGAVVPLLPSPPHPPSPPSSCRLQTGQSDRTLFKNHDETSEQNQYRTSIFNIKYFKTYFYQSDILTLYLYLSMTVEHNNISH